MERIQLLYAEVRLGFIDLLNCCWRARAVGPLTGIVSVFVLLVGLCHRALLVTRATAATSSARGYLVMPTKAAWTLAGAKT